MNQNPTQTAARWSPMVSNPDDDFANFLDFGDLSFPTFGDGSTGAAQVNGSAVSGGGTPAAAGAGPGNGAARGGGVGGDGDLQPDGDGNAMDTTVDGAVADGMLDPQLQQPFEESDRMAGLNVFPEAFNDLDASTTADFLTRQHQQHLQQQQQQQRHRQTHASAMQQMQHQQQQPPRFYGHNPVPPTPNSLEMRAGQGEFYQSHVDRQQQILYEHYRRQQNEQMNFTPLVSPAVTPLDTQFQNSDFTASADCFSPLTSPALRAQNHNVHQSLYGGGVRGSDTSDTTSPIDPSLDYTGPTSGSTPGSIRKSKRTASTSSSKTAGRSVRPSPVVKPQSRKKQPSSTVIPAKEVANILEEATSSRKTTPRALDGKLPVPYAQDSSGADSVSPEPLSEILMPPPATPKSNSAGRSPYLAAKQGGAQQPSPAISANGESPATPASLMKIRKQAGKGALGSRASSNLKEQALSADAEMEQIMEDIALPEAATNGTTKSPVKTINVQEANGIKPAKAAPPSSAPTTATTSAFPSPTASGLTSPTANARGNRTDQPRMKIRDSRKRNGSSNQISPALRPKISPSIKPLLPEGTIVSPETSALLLASKSNYQNILEGTHLPGVSYPETLSTNLTSKRTSHKIAEQGRRNRINTALQEIAALLPPQTPTADGQTPNGGQAGLMMTTGSAAQQNNSKASTVEMAIEYIKKLQSELHDVKCRLREVEGQQTRDKGSEGPEDAGSNEDIKAAEAAK